MINLLGVLSPFPRKKVQKEGTTVLSKYKEFGFYSMTKNDKIGGRRKMLIT
jgi:hypothetical protein